MWQDFQSARDRAYAPYDAYALRPEVLETTALGAAYLAGLGVGVWKSLDDIGGQWRVERRFEPRMTASRVEMLRERWHHAVERAKSWEVHPPA